MGSLGYCGVAPEIAGVMIPAQHHSKSYPHFLRSASEGRLLQQECPQVQPKQQRAAKACRLVLQGSRKEHAVHAMNRAALLFHRQP